MQNHLPGVDRGDGERDRLGNAQAVRIDDREAGPIQGHLERGDQAAAILIGADVGQGGDRRFDLPDLVGKCGKPGIVASSALPDRRFQRRDIRLDLIESGR